MGRGVREGSPGATYCEEQVTDIVRQVHGNANVGKVKAVAEGNERQRHDVVRHELLEVLARLLEPQHHDEGLLGPVRGLEQVVELEGGLVRRVGEALVRGANVKVPHDGAAHHVDARGARKGKVQRRVGLLHEALLLAAGDEAVGAREREQQLLHGELARKRQDHHVEGDKGDIPRALAVLCGRARVRLREAVRQEDEAVHGVGRARVDGVGEGKGEQQQQRDGPGMLAGETREAPQAAGAVAGSLAPRRGALVVAGRRGRGRSHGASVPRPGARPAARPPAPGAVVCRCQRDPDARDV